MGKIIIDIWDEDITDAQALQKVLEVVRMGKMSKARRGSCYCFGSHFYDGDGRDIMVSAELLKSGTHKFRVHTYKPHADKA